ncbi:MAG: putative transrane anti-sigma factor [Microbacteriaceae bacterium]|nr:putative transrane anti-sigma factor [Microbacteriaceae bacterium]
MSSDTYSEWDAAYLLGALSPTERREFERHLATCESCSAAIAELAMIPGLLARVPAEEASDLLRPASVLPVPVTLLPRLVRSVARRRRRARGLVAGALVATATVAAAIVLAIPLVFPGAARTVPPKTAEVALIQVVPSPLSASVRLVPEGWGTRIEMKCRYAIGGPTNYVPAPGSYASYAMYVTDGAGRSTQIATWTAEPGSTAEPSATTSLALDEISAVDVRSSASGQVLLQGKP